MELDLTATDEVCDFWPDLFVVDDIVSVRVRAIVIEPGDEEKHVLDLLREAQIASALSRDVQVERYASALDQVAMDLTFDQLKLFIAHYATYHSVKKAAKEAGGSIACFRHRRKIDAVFGEMWTMARENWVDDLEERGMQRATEEVDVRFSAASNDMLKFMLKGENEAYQDTVNVRHGGIEGAPPVKIEKQFDVEHLTATVSILSEVLRGNSV